MEIKIKGIYRHYSGDLYLVEDIVELQDIKSKNLNHLF